MPTEAPSSHSPNERERSSDLLLVDDGAGVRTLTFNRPEAMNAFNQELWYAAAEALDEAARDTSVNCLVLTGTGRAFTAGQDLNEMADPSIFAEQEPGYQRFMPALEAIEVPVLAAVNGVGVGLGLTVLMHCDIVYISRTARLKAPFISLGVTTEASASLLLPLTVGWQRAAEILYTEPWIGAEEAVEIGLALHLCEPEDLLATVHRQALHIGALPRGPLTATKRLLKAHRAQAVADTREREMAEFVQLVAAMGD